MRSADRAKLIFIGLGLISIGIGIAQYVASSYVRLVIGLLFFIAGGMCILKGLLGDQRFSDALSESSKGSGTGGMPGLGSTLDGVVLRDESGDAGTRWAGAELTPGGGIKIEGHDLGRGVEKVFGCSEYEWVLTIAAADVPALSKALGDPPKVLAALKFEFGDGKVSGLIDFLKRHKVPHEFRNRIGD